MKSAYSYLAICVAAALIAPPALAEPSLITPQTTKKTAGGDPVEGISDLYSDINLRMSLASKPNAKACSGDTCLTNQEFDARVQAIGARLATAAYAVYPELKKETPKFEFSVADKLAVGTASNAGGKIVIFRGVQHLDLSEEATEFLVGREMGHVISHHHKSNTKTKLLFTVLTGILFPAVSLFSASSAAAQASTATTLLSSAASTLGSEVALSSVKPDQLNEADEVSLKLLTHQGMSKADIAQSLEYIAEKDQANGWEKDLYSSIHYVRAQAGEPKEVIAELGPLTDETSFAEMNTEVSTETDVVASQAPVSQAPAELTVAGQADDADVVLAPLPPAYVAIEASPEAHLLVETQLAESAEVEAPLDEVTSVDLAPVLVVAENEAEAESVTADSDANLDTAQAAIAPSKLALLARKPAAQLDVEPVAALAEEATAQEPKEQEATAQEATEQEPTELPAIAQPVISQPVISQPARAKPILITNQTLAKNAADANKLAKKSANKAPAALVATVKKPANVASKTAKSAPDMPTKDKAPNTLSAKLKKSAGKDKGAEVTTTKNAQTKTSIAKLGQTRANTAKVNKNNESITKKISALKAKVEAKVEAGGDTKQKRKKSS